MNPTSVFKAYDIRGRTDNGDVDVELYERVGAAMVDLLGCPRVALGRDCRLSSRGFADAFTSGVTGRGADLIDLGEVPTDAVYYYSGAHEVPGAMVTASHNPPTYNGLKLCRPGALPIGSGTGLDDIRDQVVAGPPGDDVDEPGEVSQVEMIDDYVTHVLYTTRSGEIGELSVAVDAGNGMAGVALEKVFDMIPATLDGLYLECDGTFPNHPADPLVPENLEDLTNLVSDGGHDLGVAFDGDADRAFFLDDQARPLSGSTVTSLIARALLADSPGSAVVHNLITSRAVPEIVTEAGGIPVRTRVGHSFIKRVMADTDAVFGGEHSGHYYFRDNFRADSGMMAMLVLMRVLTESGKPLSTLRQEVDRYASSGEINFEVEDQEQAMAEVEQAFEATEVDRLDGLTIDLGHAWLNLRPSNTEPLLRLNVEAGTEEQVDEIVGRVRAVLDGPR